MPAWRSFGICLAPVDDHRGGKENPGNRLTKLLRPRTSRQRAVPRAESSEDGRVQPSLPAFGQALANSDAIALPWPGRLAAPLVTEMQPRHGRPGTRVVFTGEDGG